MIELSFARSFDQRPDVLCVGAHCDDIEIGCAGALLLLQSRRDGVRIHFLILTSNSARRAEAMEAAHRLLQPAACGEITVLDLEDGLLPTQLPRVRSALAAARERIDPCIVFTHHASDRHQDHAVASDATWQIFRDHLILEYEIAKYDGDLSTPNTYVPLPKSVVDSKCSLLQASFESQHAKPWFGRENFEALMRIRGIECRSPSGFAEAFHARKVTIGFGSDDRPTPG